MTDQPGIDPWLDETSLQAAAQMGISPHEYVDRAFAAERESFGHRVQQLRLQVQTRRHDLAALRQDQASDDAIATMAANIEHALEQIAALMLRSGQLDKRHRLALEALDRHQPLDPDRALAEAERLLRDEPS
jgi:hypothetical protein